MIEYPLTGARLVTLHKITFGKKVIEQGKVVEIDSVVFIEESMDHKDLCGIAFTIKGFTKKVSFPVESPHFEELEDLYPDEIVNWGN